jgi:predicted transport protein
LDNSEIERGPRVSASEDEIVRKFPHLQELFQNLKAELNKNAAEQYITGRTFRYKKHRVFAYIRLRKNYTRLGLRVGVGKIDDPDFKYKKKGASDWGSVNLSPSKVISDKVKEWIEIAREFKPTKTAEDENEEVEGDDE